MLIGLKIHKLESQQQLILVLIELFAQKSKKLKLDCVTLQFGFLEELLKDALLLY
jgi:hypothetical protein